MNYFHLYCFDVLTIIFYFFSALLYYFNADLFSITFTVSTVTILHNKNNTAKSRINIAKGKKNTPPISSSVLVTSKMVQIKLTFCVPYGSLSLLSVLIAGPFSSVLNGCFHT